VPKVRAQVDKPQGRHRSRWRWVGVALLILAALLVAARTAMPTAVRWYVNRTIDQNPLYDGNIGEIDIHLWRGAYTINQIRIVKTTGNVPVPFFAAKQVDLAIQWNALLHGKLVGRVLMVAPELNFVDDREASNAQTGDGGPWLKMIRDLFPFRINNTLIRDGSVHFRAFHTEPPVDVYLSQLNGSIDNLTNIRDDTAPLIATVSARGRAMDQADFEYEMKLNPFSYYPQFELGVRLLGLDVTKTNALARAYGAFDFEKGWFDLVVELSARGGQLQGYVKPLFRDAQVFSLRNDIREENVLQTFWEALVGVTTQVLKNPPRNQFGTVVPLRGDVSGPRTDILQTVGNVLYNAFIRAYLPRLEGISDVNGLHFDPGQVSDPLSAGERS